jgi:hypothetical protein
MELMKKGIHFIAGIIALTLPAQSWRRHARSVLPRRVSYTIGAARATLRR